MLVFGFSRGLLRLDTHAVGAQIAIKLAAKLIRRLRKFKGRSLPVQVLVSCQPLHRLAGQAVEGFDGQLKMLDAGVFCRVVA